MINEQVENNIDTSLEWEMVEKNKWASKVTKSNYLFVIISPKQEGKYELKYVDAELNDYTRLEKDHVRKKHNIMPFAFRELALKVIEHYGHYDWIEEVDSKIDLATELINRTSFNMSLLCNLENLNEDKMLEVK